VPSSQKVRCAVFSVSYLSRLVSCWMLRAVLNGGPSAAVSSGKQNTSCSGMRLFRLGGHGGAGFGGSQSSSQSAYSLVAVATAYLPSRKRSNRADKKILHRILGVPFFLPFGKACFQGSPHAGCAGFPWTECTERYTCVYPVVQSGFLAGWRKRFGATGCLE